MGLTGRDGCVVSTRALVLATIMAMLLVAVGLPPAPAAADAPGDTVGIHRDGRFLLRHSNSGGAANRDFIYGRSGDEPLVGDWNGDGVATVGVRRGSQFFLRNSNSGGPANISFYYGRASDEVVVGDFNGDGRDTIGVRRGSEFHLRNSNSGGPAHVSFHFGRAGDEPLVGDWNGNGTATVGVRRGSQFFLRNSNSGGAANISFYYGRASDEVVVGDWNGNGTDTVGVRRGSQFHLRNSNSGGAANLSFYYGRSSDAPLAGRWTPPPARDQVVGEFTTPLVAGQSRNVNIHRALDLINGDVIAPGATYSLNRDRPTHRVPRVRHQRRHRRRGPRQRTGWWSQPGRGDLPERCVGVRDRDPPVPAPLDLLPALPDVSRRHAGLGQPRCRGSQRHAEPDPDRDRAHVQERDRPPDRDAVGERAFVDERALQRLRRGVQRHLPTHRHLPQRVEQHRQLLVALQPGLSRVIAPFGVGVAHVSS
jgi:hypothetical protein